MAPYAALLVEDDPFMRQAVGDFLMDMGYRADSASDYQEGVRFLQRMSPYRLVVLDISIPRSAGKDSIPREPLGLELVRQAKEKSSDTGVIVWSAYTHYLAKIVDLILEGERGLAYLPKGSSAKALQAAIDQVVMGNVFIHGSAISGEGTTLVPRFLAALPPETVQIIEAIELRLPELSPRQAQVASLMAYTPQGIADQLQLEVRTVRNYQDTIYEKLGLRGQIPEVEPYRREVLIYLATFLHQLRSESKG